MTLVLYLSRLIGNRVLLALLGLTALLQIVDLLDSARTLFAAGEGFHGMAKYALWRLPMIVEQILPMAVLAGTLVSLFTLVRHNEIVAMRAAGVTSYRLLANALPVALVMTLLHFVLANGVTPWAEANFSAWWETVQADAKSAEGKPVVNDEARRVWMRAADTIIAVAAEDGRRRGMRNLTFITVNADGSVQRRVEARTATLEGGTWMLHDVRNIRAEGSAFTVTRATSTTWPAAVSAEEVLSIVAAPQRLSLGRLVDVLQGTTPATASHAFYWTTLYHNLALLVTAPLMVLLSLPAAYGSARHGGAGRGLVLGALLGIGSLAVDGILTAMGEVGLVPPLLAAWTTPLVFACVGGTILLRLEDP